MFWEVSLRPGTWKSRTTHWRDAQLVYNKTAKVGGSIFPGTYSSSLKQVTFYWLISLSLAVTGYSAMFPLNWKFPIAEDLSRMITEPGVFTVYPTILAFLVLLPRGCLLFLWNKRKDFISDIFLKLSLMCYEVW